MKKIKKYLRGPYKKDPKRIYKNEIYQFTFTKDDMSKLKEIAELKGISSPEVLRQMIRAEHLKS